MRRVMRGGRRAGIVDRDARPFKGAAANAGRLVGPGIPVPV